MIRAQPLIVLHDVESGSKWFQDVLGLRSGHGGADYEMLMDGEQMVAQLHHWDVDDHPHLGDPSETSRGNGVLLWFHTDDFRGVVHQVEAARIEVLEGPRLNPNSKQYEI